MNMAGKWTMSTNEMYNGLLFHVEMKHFLRELKMLGDTEQGHELRALANVDHHLRHHHNNKSNIFDYGINTMIMPK
jgi:hypothetical protein